jgi:hypothetical protein
MFSQLSTLQMAGWGSIYKPHGESSRWGWNLAFCYWPDAQVVLIGRVWSSRPLKPTVGAHYWSDSLASPVAYHLTRPVNVSLFWNLSDLIGCHCLARPVVHSCCVRSSLSCCRDDEQWSPCVRSLPRSEFGRYYGRLLLLSNWSDTSGPHKGRVRSPLPSSFVRDLVSGLVRMFVLGLCLVSWVFYCASRVLLEVLIIRSSRHLRPSHVCNLLDYKSGTRKHISPIWSCWSSNTKIQSKWAKGLFFLQSLFFGDRWQHDQSKQIIKILELKNYLLSRMQCKGKFIWCKKITLVCISMTTYLALAKCPHVALWI